MVRYTLTKLNKLGEFDATYGQSYWGSVTEDLKPVKFNSQNQDIKAGDIISFEESINKTSTKGTAYLQLKKVRVEGASPLQPLLLGTDPKDTPRDTPVVLETLSRIEAKLDKLLGSEEY